MSHGPPLRGRVSPWSGDWEAWEAPRGLPRAPAGVQLDIVAGRVACPTRLPLTPFFMKQHISAKTSPTRPSPGPSMLPAEQPETTAATRTTEGPANEPPAHTQPPEPSPAAQPSSAAQPAGTPTSPQAADALTALAGTLASTGDSGGPGAAAAGEPLVPAGGGSPALPTSTAPAATGPPSPSASSEAGGEWVHVRLKPLGGGGEGVAVLLSPQPSPPASDTEAAGGAAAGPVEPSAAPTTTATAPPVLAAAAPAHAATGHRPPSPTKPPAQAPAPWPLPGPGFSRLRSLGSGVNRLLPQLSGQWRADGGWQGPAGASLAVAAVAAAAVAAHLAVWWATPRPR